MDTIIVANPTPAVKPVIALGADSLGRQWYRVECATCNYGAIEGRDAAALAGGRLCTTCEAVVKPLPATAAERVRELALTHQSICRYRRQGLACSTCHDLMAAATRLWLKAAELDARRAALEASR